MSGAERASGVRAARRKRAERAQRKQRQSSRTPQHSMNVGTAIRARCPSIEGRLGHLASPTTARRASISYGFDLYRVVMCFKAMCEGAMLSLPDVAELVRDEIVRRVGALQEDRPPERVAVVAAEAGDPEEPWRDEDAHALDAHGLRVVVERVEAGLRAFDRGARATAPLRHAAAKRTPSGILRDRHAR